VCALVGWRCCAAVCYSFLLSLIAGVFCCWCSLCVCCFGMVCLSVSEHLCFGIVCLVSCASLYVCVCLWVYLFVVVEIGVLVLHAWW